MSQLQIRPPSNSQSYHIVSFTPPSTQFMTGKWHVTHSSLPMWRSNRNVIITYTPLESGAWDDLVEYQPLNSNKLKSVVGIDTPDATVPAAYNWRGKGWLKIASSHWEVLGWGEEEGGWVVTFFQKTLFTPAGIDIYARRKGGLSAGLLEQIKNGLREVNDESFTKLVARLFEVRHDW